MLVFQDFTGDLAKVFFSEGSTFLLSSRNSSELNGKVTGLLGEDILSNSEVVEARRAREGVKLVVESSEGRRVRVEAKRLLAVFAPTPGRIPTPVLTA